jgi:DNA primase
MSFPPRFLDELRQRLSLAEIVGRRVKLIRRGREYVGLCPFHKEKTPSFSVVEDKGFYHCFGCGAHGDVIGFAMQMESLSFPEAVTALAAQAGLAVPQLTRAESDRAERVAGIADAVEAACVFFAEMLAAPEGREGRLYLDRRGLDEGTIRRFRLGFAPERRDALKAALAKRFPEALLIEAGLLRRPEEGGESYDYFRGRIIFPIGDRRGRIIAFGGRVVGEGQPKYLNSPDTPLFEKGRVLYGWAAARAAAAREPSAIVVEGYMDVIALHRAGFATAVAPLGTALTEAQIEELWRLAPEPVLCFDGDAAGLRAAGRALERALPLLRPGCSLSFATLPEGEDPDTLILRQGAGALREVLERARPLAEVLWSLETARPMDTPERRAALEQRLEARIRLIADRSVQQHYREYLRERIFAAFARGRSFVRGRGAAGRPRGGWNVAPASPPRWPEAPPAGDPALLRRRQQEVLVALLLNHPFLLHEVAEDLAQLELPAGDLDRLCSEILRVHAHYPDLEAATLRLHLSRNGYDGAVAGVLSPQVLNHAAFARADAEPETARAGWVDTLSQFQQRRIAHQIKTAERETAEDLTDEKWARLHQTLLESKGDDDASGGEGH